VTPQQRRRSQHDAPTRDACDPVSKEPELKAAAVRVKKLEDLQID
jgi:hypothetical protein